VIPLWFWIENGKKNGTGAFQTTKRTGWSKASQKTSFVIQNYFFDMIRRLPIMDRDFAPKVFFCLCRTMNFIKQETGAHPLFEKNGVVMWWFN